LEFSTETIYFVSQSAFFMQEQQPTLEAIQDIRRIMDRSSRFISLSGLSGISAGVSALAGAWWAGRIFDKYYLAYTETGDDNTGFQQLKWKLLIVAGIVFVAALASSLFFTWRKASRDRQALWNATSRRLVINMMIPLIAGGIFVVTMLQYDEWRFVAPACMIFYGIALVNGSKYTLGEVRYLGISEIILGLVAAQPVFVGYGLYFWALGFGVLHIIYGIYMWMKYERKENLA